MCPAPLVVPARISGMVSGGRLPVPRTLWCLLYALPCCGDRGPSCCREPSGIVPCVPIVPTDDGGRSQGRFPEYSLCLAARGRPLLSVWLGCQGFRVEVVSRLVGSEQTGGEEARGRGGIGRRGAGRGVGVVDGRGQQNRRQRGQLGRRCHEGRGVVSG